jgi:hypothetical protein
MQHSYPRSELAPMQSGALFAGMNTASTAANAAFALISNCPGINQIQVVKLVNFSEAPWNQLSVFCRAPTKTKLSFSSRKRPGLRE